MEKVSSKTRLVPNLVSATNSKNSATTKKPNNKTILVQYDDINRKLLRESKKVHQKFMDEFGIDILEFEHDYFAQKGNPLKPLTARDLKVITPTTIKDQKMELVSEFCIQIKQLMISTAKKGDYKHCGFTFPETLISLTPISYNIDEIRPILVHILNTWDGIVAIPEDKTVMDNGKPTISKRIVVSWSEELSKHKPAPSVTSSSQSIYTSDDEQEMIELARRKKSVPQTHDSESSQIE
jgi:hypothetical protein